MEGGQRRTFAERVTLETVGNRKYASVYQPL